MADIMALLAQRLVFFDGGMGTLLQAMGLKGGERPEQWNLTHPERVLSAHAAYLKAGCDVITSNSFGATRAHLGEDAESCMRQAVRIAKRAVAEAGRGQTAADMGSLGQLLQPYGGMPFEEAVHQFAEAFQWAIEEKPDLLLIETMTDLMEIKACVLGAKEAMARLGARLPLFASLTFDARGRLLTGADIPGTAAMLAGLRVDAIGLNCGDEPAALMDNLRTLLNSTSLPVFFSPNASLPVVRDGVTTFPTTPETFAAEMRKAALLGARGLGGCCGTTPAHIERLIAECAGIQPVQRESAARCIISGRCQSAALGERPVLIGERLNPTGKPQMKRALREHDMDYLRHTALSQRDAGADALDVNVGLPDIDEPAMLREATQAIQQVCDLPLQLDTANPDALEAALRTYAGRPLINSVCGKQSVMDAVFPLAAKYGGALVCLTLDENGIPETAEERVNIARRILREAEKYGIGREDLLFDALTMTVATNPSAAEITLQTVRALKNELRVKTVLGVSNVSFGLPQRPLLTAAFLSAALMSGLDAAIMNPNDLTVHASFDAAAALFQRDEGFTRYLARRGGENAKLSVTLDQPAAQPPPADTAPLSESETPVLRLRAAIERGLSGDAAREARNALSDAQPLCLIENAVMPALGAVGDAYERGTLFLPQLLQSASAAQAAFEVIRQRIPPTDASQTQTVVLATVQGDVHDIGKNIVKVLLQNYGFEVLDLGKDVPPAVVADAAERSGTRVVGLSALMTTTVPAMRDTVALLHQRLPGVKVMVGGAVLSEDFARTLHADGYAADAMAAVRLAREWTD